MLINTSDDNNFPPEVYYEEQASQEELYLEETEEELRAVLISDDQVPSGTKAEYWRSKIEEVELDWEVEDSMTNVNNNLRIAANLDEQLDHAAEELITGDSDDPPLSEQTVLEMLRVAHIPKRSAP